MFSKAPVLFIRVDGDAPVYTKSPTLVVCPDGGTGFNEYILLAFHAFGVVISDALLYSDMIS